MAPWGLSRQKETNKKNEALQVYSILELIFDPEHEQEFLRTGYLVTSCHGVRTRRSNIPRRGVQERNIHGVSDIDERIIRCDGKN